MFLRCAIESNSEGANEDGDDENNMMCGSSALQCIVSVLANLEGQGELHAVAVTRVMPVLSMCLNPLDTSGKYVEFLEDIVAILECCRYVDVN